MSGALNGVRFSLDYLPKFTRILWFIKNGSEFQIPATLSELSHMVHHEYNEAITEIVPFLCDELTKWPEELQLLAAETLVEVADQTVPKKVLKLMCNTAFKVVWKNRTIQTFEAWGELLVLMLPNVEWKTDGHVKKIESMLTEYSASKQEVCRKFAARILGPFFPCISSSETQVHLLNQALALIDDVDVDVRGMMAESLGHICANFDIAQIEKEVWPKLEAMFTDPDARFQAASLRVFARIVDAKYFGYPSNRVFTEAIPSIFREVCDYALKAAAKDQRIVDDDTYLLLEIISEVFGQLLHGASLILHDTEVKTHVLHTFVTMASCNGPIVRRHCSLNVPGVAKILGAQCSMSMAKVVRNLSEDTDPETRWNLAAGIHESCRALRSDECIDFLYKAVENLLHDENPLVRINAMKNLSNLIAVLTKEKEHVALERLASVFNDLSSLAKTNWRTQELLTYQLEYSVHLVPPDIVKCHILPLLLAMGEESTQAVRKSIMSAVAECLLYIPIMEERKDVMETFIMKWAYGGVYWRRIAFIDCACAAWGKFSFDLFQSLFVPTLYHLANDDVANIRHRVANMLPRLGPFLRDTEDFKQVADDFRCDPDDEVVRAVEDLSIKIEEQTEIVFLCRREYVYRKKDENRRESQAIQEQIECPIPEKRASVVCSLNAVTLPSSSKNEIMSSVHVGRRIVKNMSSCSDTESPPSAPNSERQTMLRRILSLGRRTQPSSGSTGRGGSSARSVGFKAFRQLLSSITVGFNRN